MISISASTKAWAATEPVDFRKGIDGLSVLCRAILKQDPMSGHVFVFANRKRTAIKALFYDGQGFWLAQKRLSEGKFAWWPSPGDPACSLSSRELMVLLSAGDPRGAQMKPDWRKVA